MTNDNIHKLDVIEGGSDQPQPMLYTLTYQTPDGMNTGQAEGWLYSVGGLVMVMNRDGHTMFATQLSMLVSVVAVPVPDKTMVLN